MNATIRYCLKCSAGSETLVARTCPVLDIGREKAAERRGTKKSKERERAVAKREAKRRRKVAREEAILDSPGGTTRDVETAMRRLDQQWPASVVKARGRLFLRTSSDPDTLYGPAMYQVFGRAAFAVILDYASAIGHPYADVMQNDFKKLSQPTQQ